MSISSFTMVTMLDTRPAPITIAMPRTNDIPNRVITFKDIYGSAVYSTITLVTQGGDVFENSSFSTILSNAYDTITFHAGLPGRWHRTAGTNVVGSITNASTFTNSISTSVAYAKTFYGDGSQLTGVLTTGTTTTFSNITVIASISNNGWLSNTGAATFGGGLTVTSGTTTTGLLVSGNYSNTGNFSNIGTLSNTGLATFGGGLTVASGTTNLGITNTTTLVTTNISNAGTFSNVGALSNTGLATFGGSIYNTGNISNVGTLSNTGAATFGGGLTVASGTTTTGLLVSGNHSNTGNFSNVGTLSNTGAATFGGGLTVASGTTTLGGTTAGALTTASISNTGIFSNVGALSNTGAATFGGGLTVASGTTTTGLLVSGNHSNTGNFSNVGTLSNTGAATFGGGLTVASGTTTLQVTLTSGFSNTGNLCNSGLISTNTLNAGAISNNNLTFYDQYTASTGTFRYSTLTAVGLISIPPTSLLYFNNFVVAGAYVWPGQLISGLDQYIYSNITLLHTNAINITGSAVRTFVATGGANSICLCSNISGGTPPYFIADTALGAHTFAYHNVTFPAVAYTNATFGYITSSGNATNIDGTTCIAALSDSSSPPFVRYITVQFSV